MILFSLFFADNILGNLITDRTFERVKKCYYFIIRRADCAQVCVLKGKQAQHCLTKFRFSYFSSLNVCRAALGQVLNCGTP